MADAIFLEYPVRALGYSWCAAESIAYVSDYRFIDLLYLSGLGYVVVHCVCAAVMDEGVLPFCKALVFNILGTMVCPVLIIFHVTRLTWSVLRDIDIGPYRVRKWIPCIVGLVCTCALAGPMDEWAIAVTGMILGKFGK